MGCDLRPGSAVASRGGAGASPGATSRERPAAGALAAAVALLAACGPRVSTGTTEALPPRQMPERVAAQAAPLAAGGLQALVGELCPAAAAGRPAVAPLVLRGLQWEDAPAELARLVERGGAPRFVVFGVDGRPAGAFDTLGAVDAGLPQEIASGTFVGAGPCTRAGEAGARVDDAACRAATAGCGLAVAPVVTPGEPPAPRAFATGGACVAGGALAVDVDGDGAVEAFPLAALLDGIRGPSAEWSAAPAAPGPCAPAFALFGVRLPPPDDGRPPADARYAVDLDVLGVLDLDGDGRRELVLALRFPALRTLLVYAPTRSPGRLELVGEGTSFPR